MPTFFGQAGNLLGNVFEFKQRGQSGLWVSDLLPNLAQCADKLTVIRTMVSKSANHMPAVAQMNTGFILTGFPSMGAWVVYALGIENEDLPSFVVLPDARAYPWGGTLQWSNGFLRQAGTVPVWETEARDSTNPKPKLPYFKLFTLPTGTEGGGTPSGTEKYYSYNYGIIHFVVLDSQGSDRSPTGPMLTWLTTTLLPARIHGRSHFFIIPPTVKATTILMWNSRWPKCAPMRCRSWNKRVDLVLSAHSNSYERSFFLNGHYGPSNTLTPGMILNAGDGRPASEGGNGAYFKPAGANNAGTVYAVVGSSGFAVAAPLNHPAMHGGLSQLGSMAINTLNKG